MLIDLGIVFICINAPLQMQTIYLPPGGKVINVPGVGQTIYLPSNSAGISRAPPTKG